MNALEEQIRQQFPVSALTRNTIADGDKLQDCLLTPLNNIDSAIMQYLYNLSGNAYLHDNATNSIYHYQDNDPTKAKVYAFSANSFSAKNAQIQNVSANNISATNITAYNITANNEVTLLSAANAPMNTLQNIVDYLLQNWRTLYSYVEANSANWSSISAISATGMSRAFTGNTFALSAGDDVNFNVNSSNDTVTINADVGVDLIYTRRIGTDAQGNVYYTLVFE